MNTLKALMRLAQRFSPNAIELAHKRLYSGARFFANHKLLEGLDRGEVRLALHLVKAIRPDEKLFPEEEKLIQNFDPRGARRRKGGQIQS
jgi:hypothetical protein